MSYALNLWVFFVLLLGIIIVPGMDMAFVVTNSVTRGYRFGLAATFGIMLGGAFHTLFGAMAAGALSKLPHILVNGLLIAGSLYMAWISWTLLRSSISFQDGVTDNRAAVSRVFWQGTITCLLNPKAYLFVLAVYPQFIRPHYGPIASQALAMGTLTVLTQLVVYGGLGFAAGYAREAMKRNQTATQWIGRLAGGLFMAVAVLTLWTALRR